MDVLGHCVLSTLPGSQRPPSRPPLEWFSTCSVSRDLGNLFYVRMTEPLT